MTCCAQDGAPQDQRTRLLCSGYADIPTPTPALDTLGKLFKELPAMQMLSASRGEVYDVDTSLGRTAFAVAPSDVAKHMRWFWACNEETLAIFDDAAEECLNFLE